MGYRYRTWYMTLIAAYYLVLCSANTLYLASRYFSPGSIYTLRELLALGGAVSGWLYFSNSEWGHKGLLALTVVTIMAIGETDRGGTAFHLAILVLLLLPFFTRRPTYTQEPARSL